jgi:hypothetical protein
MIASLLSGPLNSGRDLFLELIPAAIVIGGGAITIYHWRRSHGKAGKVWFGLFALVVLGLIVSGHGCASSHHAAHGHAAHARQGSR